MHENAGAGYWLKWDDGPADIELKAVSCDKAADVALLTLSPADRDQKPVLQKLPIGEWGAAVGSGWSAPSYPTIANDAQVTLTGIIKAVRLEPGADVFELHLAGGGSISWGGASGSPLHVDGRVVAMIVTELQGMSTLHAVSVEPVLSLSLLAESAAVQTEFRKLIATCSEDQLEKLAAGLPEIDADGVPSYSANDIADYGITYGVQGMLSLLEQLPSTEEKRHFALGLVTSTFKRQRMGWPLQPLRDDRWWVRHADAEAPSSLKNAWKLFLGAEDWHAQLTMMVEKLRAKQDTLPLQNRALKQRLRCFDLQAPFRQLCEGLSVLVNDIEKEIDRAHSQQHEIEREAITLIRQHIQPTMPRGRCFFLLGSSGSGKTHFLERLMTSPMGTELCLQVAWPKVIDLTVESLEAAILSALYRATERRFASLQQFQETLDRYENARNAYCDGYANELWGPAPMLVVAFDNLQAVLPDPQVARNVCAVLQTLIENATSYRSVRWLFTLQDTFFDRLTMPVDQPSFWEEYGWINSKSSVRDAPFADLAKAGWVDLDRICVCDCMGQAIMSNAFGDGWDRAITHDRCESDMGLREGKLQHYMAIPWFAWILVSMGNQWCIGAIQSGDLNHICIVEELLKQKVRPLNASEEGRLQLERYLTATAAALLPGDGSGQHNQKFIGDVSDRFAEAGVTFVADQLQWALDLLIKSNLLLEQKDVLQTLLMVEFVMLWGYEGAKYLRHILQGRDSTSISERLRADLASAEEDRLMLKESVLEFLLMLADQEGATSLIDRILALNSHELGESAAAILFAAPKLGNSTQQRLSRFDVQPATAEGVVKGRRLLLAKMMFAEWANSSAFTPAERLDFVRTQYQNIRMSGFASYYRTVAFGILSEVTSIDELRACLLSLNGCEQSGLAEPLARRAVELLFEFAGQEEDGADPMHVVIETIVRYTTDSIGCAKDDYLRRQAPRSDVGVRGEPRKAAGSSWKREFFREWVLHHACTQLVNELKPVSAFQAFYSKNWFQVGGKGDLHIEMEREATLAIGHYFHGTQHLAGTWRQGKGKEFFDLVHALACSSDKDKRLLAFNLMLHTKPTGGDYDQGISAEFIPILERLAYDSKLAGMKRFQGLYKSTTVRRANATSGKDGKRRLR
ncbi:serine protease [Chromobacterium piscinae]|nr:serine protease [Chromobacterium piscinae]MCD5326661.1 serine protease [Chromobacterium piscinae]